MLFSTAFPTGIKAVFGLLYSLIFAVSSVLTTTASPYIDTMPEIPQDFEPAIRFVVFTDNHSVEKETYNPTDNVEKMINTCFSIYGEDGIDLFASCGDFTEFGKNGEMAPFVKAFYETIGDKAETLVVLGNHDLKLSEDVIERFKTEFGVDVGEQHKVINGFHFIGVPSCNPGAVQVYPSSMVSWAKDALAEAEADSDNLPVFSFQHAHNTGTVYGSTIWGSPGLSSVWNGHNRVVNFSGHSHFPLEDPRSIWQGSYTAVGVGAMNRFELEKDLIWGQHPDKYDTAAEFYVVEADRDGSVALRAYDLQTDNFFLSYYIDNVNDPSTYAYTYKNRLAYDEAPVFGENAEVTCSKNDKGETLLTFDRAYDKLAVHDYKITVTNSIGIPVLSKTYLSDYYLHNVPEQFTVNLGELNIDSGKEFRVKITAVNSYYELSQPVTATLTMV